MKLRKTVLAVACAMPLGSSPALAHGDYDWINKGGYRNSSGEHCCGKDDCFEVEPSRVLQTPHGYSLPDHNVDVPGEKAIPSEDGKFWICKVGTRMRCFFAPLNAS